MAARHSERSEESRQRGEGAPYYHIAIVETLRFPSLCSGQAAQGDRAGFAPLRFYLRRSAFAPQERHLRPNRICQSIRAAASILLSLH